MHVNSMNIIEQEAINQLKNDPFFLNSRTFREQVGIACSHLRTEYSRISYSRIASMFDVNKGTIKDQEKKYQNGVLPDGCHPSFTHDELGMLFNYIDSSLNDNCLTFNEVSDYVFLKFGKDILKYTLRHVIHREFGDDFKTVIGIPLDSKRVDVEPEKID